MRVAMSDDMVRWLLLEAGCLLVCISLVSMSSVSVVTVEDR